MQSGSFLNCLDGHRRNLQRVNSFIGPANNYLLAFRLLQLKCQSVSCGTFPCKIVIDSILDLEIANPLFV